MRGTRETLRVKIKTHSVKIIEIRGTGRGGGMPSKKNSQIYEMLRGLAVFRKKRALYCFRQTFVDFTDLYG